MPDLAQGRAATAPDPRHDPVVPQVLMEPHFVIARAFLPPVARLGFCICFFAHLQKYAYLCYAT